MNDPPPYDDSSLKPYEKGQGDEKVDCLKLSVVEQVEISRSQRVALVVEQVFQEVQGRARKGLSDTLVYLLPLDQEVVRTGKLAGHSTSKPPIIVELDADDSLEFWSQEDALKELQQQLLAAVLEGVPQSPALETLIPSRTVPQTKTSWWRNRKQENPLPMTPPTPRAEPVTTEVSMDELYFRKESEYGLLETGRANAIMITVVVR